MFMKIKNYFKNLIFLMRLLPSMYIIYLHSYFIFIRSVQMRLYTMHKREFVMVFIVFFATLGLALFIGLAGMWLVLFFDITLDLFRQNTYLQNKKHMLTCQRWDWLL